MKPIHIEGIRGISLSDITFAAELGYRVKLLAIIKQIDGDVQIRVHPTLVPIGTLLSDVSEVFNAVMVRGDIVGETLFYGRGAGRDATASAVVSDLVDVALNLKFGSHRRVSAFRENPQFNKVMSIDDIHSRYYLRLQVEDKPGVLAKIADFLNKEKISISSVLQKEGQSPDNVSLLILTHSALEKSVKNVISQCEALREVKESVRLLRIEDI